MAQANRALRQLPDDAREAVRTVAGVTAFQVSREAAAEVPIGKGARGIHLRNAIEWAWSGAASAVVRVQKAAFYWKYLEYGTKFIAARGMFRRAGDRHREEHRRRLLDALRRANSKLDRAS